jgi:hypothetical protein
MGPVAEPPRLRTHSSRLERDRAAPAAGPPSPGSRMPDGQRRIRSVEECRTCRRRAEVVRAAKPIHHGGYAPSYQLAPVERQWANKPTTRTDQEESRNDNGNRIP